jgi:hypothetical protein
VLSVVDGSNRTTEIAADGNFDRLYCSELAASSNELGSDSSRGTGITAYLENGGTLEKGITDFPRRASVKINGTQELRQSVSVGPN